MLQKEFKSAVKSVLGTCASVGIFVENKNPNALIKKIDKGEFEKEISSQSTETSSEKRQKLNQFFMDIEKAQEELMKKEKAEAEEAEKAETKPEAKKEAGEVKEEVKKQAFENLYKHIKYIKL